MVRVVTGTALLILLIFGALFYPWLSPFDPLKPDYRARYAAPSGEHLLGTDGLGRDVLTRSLAGGRVSLSIALSASALAVVLGSGLGLAAAAFGGTPELLLTRAFDALLAFPGFLLVLLAVVILGGGSAETVLALGVAGSPLYFRLARSYTRSLLITPYVLAATALGASLPRLLSHHVLPNFLGPILVQAASTATVFLLVEASLSYLGLGVPLPTPSWGNVLQDARAYLTRQPWAALGPGALLALAALALQLLSDGLRDFLDRRTR
ncbi:MAG: ABC transporter permease [Trueperaceae bacterium]|nr:MAG: ABC transporter permease [Trueperaceae bacterium]